MCKNVKGLVSSCLWLTFLALMACSGSKGGVRLNAEKINIEREKNDNRPLYIVNGHILPFNESLDTLLQVKHKYLKDVQIIDAEKSASRYGKAGKYGAVEITLTDSTAAYNDLMDPNSSTNIMKLNPFKQALGTRKPTLIGGLANLQRKLKYPENCRDAGAEGQVIVRFIVNKRGQIEDPSIIRGIGWGCDAAVIRLVKQSAEFLPALHYGKPVNVHFRVPFNFILQ